MPLDSTITLADVGDGADAGEVAAAGASRGGIRAISRGLDVLQVINQHRSIGMMAIATLCGIPYPTACRIVDTLLAEDMIERETTRKHYRPTARVKTLSVGYQQDDELAQAARMHITRLTRDLCWPISVCTRVGMSMMICESTHAIAPSTFNVYHPGYTMPLFGSSSGKVHLAFCGEADRRAALKQLAMIGAADTTRILAALDTEIASIRARGYATYARIRHTANPGKTSGLSVPILAGSALEGTLTLAFFASAMPLQRAVDTLVPRLKACAAAIGEELQRGHRRG